MFVKFNLDKILSEDSLFEENQKKMNQIVCKSIAFASLAIPVMLILNAMGLFKFSLPLSVVLVVFGGFCTLSPLLVLKLVKNQVFVRYYALCCVILLISCLATQYYVGIYLTFLLAPILSCLYFNKSFTVQIVGLSYLGFLISYYFRAIEIRNRLYPTETILENYLPIVVGYTIEFAVSLHFFYKLVNRAHTLMVEQEAMISEMAKGEVKTKLALAATTDILSEYDIINDAYSSNGTIRGWKRKDITIEHFMDYVRLMNWKSDTFLNYLKKYISAPEEMGNYFREEVDLSYTEGEKLHTVWVFIELNVLRDSEGKPETLIGKVRDITQSKLEGIKSEEAKKADPLTGMYSYISMHKIIKEMAGYYADALHQIMIVNIKNVQEITKCYGAVYRDFVLMNVAEVIRNAVSDEGILTCRLSECVFLIYIADTEKTDDMAMRNKLNTGLVDMYVGDREVTELEYDFGYYIGEEEIDELVSVALRYVGAEELSDMQKETFYAGETALVNEKTYRQLSDVERTPACKSFLKNITMLMAGTEDIPSAIQMALAGIGRFFALSGIRIYEIPDTTQSVLAEFFWAADEKVEKECNRFALTVEVRDLFVQKYANCRIVNNVDKDFRKLFERFGKNPLCLDGYSGLICPVLQDGVCRALILYDKAGESVWSDEEEKLLVKVGEIIKEDLLAFVFDSIGKTQNAVLSNFSYELRSQINAIMGMTEIARGQLENAEQVVNCLDSIDVSSQQLVTIVNDVFDLSKMELGKMKFTNDVFSLENMMAQIEKQMILEAKHKDIEFILQRKFQEDLLYGDASRIFQVVSYLIENALRYTKCGGCVRAMVEETANSGDDVTLFIEVQDNEEGIRPEQKEKMFVVFEQDDAQQKEKQADTGLDLAVCYHLVQMMGADLEVKGEAGQGTTFYFTLKVALPDAEQKLHYMSEQEGRKKGAIDLMDKKVLLAEDNAVSADILKRLLERQGAEVILAENGEVCLEKFCQSEIGEITVILMDVNMPVMNGHEATRKLRRLDRKDANKVPVIAMTANAFEEDMEQSLAAGMDAHLSKPVQMKALLEEIGNAIAKSEEK